MMKKLDGFKNSDIVTMDTLSLRELAQARESQQAQQNQKLARAMRERKRAETFFRNLPSKGSDKKPARHQFSHKPHLT